ncbi:hypothetical protein K449DRAFT_400369 [Hypoxylon sp. EC38]|nr:hypothetical protein K449DRAFT_400369 [Hypoxylon sp. EC38]
MDYSRIVANMDMCILLFARPHHLPTEPPEGHRGMEMIQGLEPSLHSHSIKISRSREICRSGSYYEPDTRNLGPVCCSSVGNEHGGWPLNACESSQEAYDCGSVQFTSVCHPSSRGGTAVDARDGIAE